MRPIGMPILPGATDPALCARGLRRAVSRHAPPRSSGNATSCSSMTPGRTIALSLQNTPAR